MRMPTNFFTLAYGLFGYLSFSMAQVPNGNFETWTSGGGAMKPTGWITTNSLANYYGTEPTCEQGTPGFTGNYYARVISRTGPGGVFLLGTMATGDTASSRRGFPYTWRPAALEGQWQYTIKPFDMGEVTVALTRWNNATGMRDQIAYGTVWITDSIDSWEPFQVTLDYAFPDDPDTAIVTVNASASLIAMAPGSTMSVDELKFTGIAGVDEAPNAFRVYVYPVPVTGPVHVSAPGPMRRITVQDMGGRIVLEGPASGTSAQLDLADLAPGRYVLGITMANGTRVVKPLMKG
ncbi:MAG: hypothetical protein KBH07_04015 [Flavobacteriales bacterium]|nr:hypothetical protein [Flavobacteriales bacterium]